MAGQLIKPVRLLVRFRIQGPAFPTLSSSRYAWTPILVLGREVRAWQRVLDKDGSNRVGWHESRAGRGRAGKGGRVRRAWSGVLAGGEGVVRSVRGS